MQSDDTIVAISSAVGAAARMIVRLSGREAPRIAAAICPSFEAEHLSPRRREMHFADLAVPGWVYFFQAPNSYTGEQVIELHIPGNPLLAKLLLDSLVRTGARQAEPGEFTARAYFNGKLDLTKAEGISATIAASNDRELHAARRLLGGELAQRLRPVIDSIAATLALVEAGIDFSEEDVSFISSTDLADRIRQGLHSLQNIIDESARFERITHEPRIVLAGRPNAGKSTLLNALAGHRRAVTSPVSGTTRDPIWAHVELMRGTVRVIDVAGIESEPPTSINPSVENQIALRMEQAARRALESAEIVVLVREFADKLPPLSLGVEPDLVVISKIDLAAGADFIPHDLAVSGHTGQNMDQLRQQLDALAFGATSAVEALALNNRHIEAITTSIESLRRAQQAVGSRGAELIALDLREALDVLGSVLGAVTPDDVLGRIFAGFCIGK